MNDLKKILAVFLAALAIFTVTPAIDYAVPQAETSIVAEAATLKLSKSKLTLVVGKSAKLKVKGTKKKVKWSTSNKKIATVKNGKVVAKKEGKATITAKVGKKRLKCKVTVKPVPISVKNIKATYYKAKNSNAIIAILKNNNKRAVSVHMSVVFYDASGKMIDTYGDSNYCFEAGRTCALHVVSPTGGYAKYKATLSVDETYYAKKTYVKYISYKHNMSPDGTKVLIESTNKTSKELDTIRASVVYFDANGQVMDYDYTYLHCNKAGQTSDDSFYVPYDKSSENYERIQPASYQVFIDHAYIY